MNVWNKVLMALIAVICVVFGIFASNKYTLIKDKDTEIKNKQEALAKAVAELETLKFEVYGGATDVDVKHSDWTAYGLDEQLKYVRNLQRGDSFVNCEPVEARVQPDEGSSSLSFVVDERYQTSSFREGSMVYVFDSGKRFVAAKSDASEADADSGAESEVAATDAASDEDAADESVADESQVAAVKPFVFLGAYRVTGVADRQVKLDSIGVATEAELDTISASKRSGDSWVVYVDNLPVDSPKDVAYFTEKYNEIALGFSEESRKFMTKSFELAHVDAAVAPASEAGADAEDDSDAASDAAPQTAAITPVDLPNWNGNSDMRYPIDFQGRLERLWCSRDSANVYRAQTQVALNVLTSLIADQFAMIGPKTVKGVDVDMSKLESVEGWDEAYAAAKERMKSTTLYDEYAARQKELATMEAGRDLVKRLLGDANKSIEELQKAIASSISTNAKLALQIANAQFEALKKLQSESAQATASDNSNFSLNDARF